MANVIVYGSDGRAVWRLRKSIASLRRVGVADDIVILTVGEFDANDPYLRKECRHIIPVDGILRDIGFHDTGWNRVWAYASFAIFTMPLVPELAKYDRALLIESDVLALNPRFREWLVWPTRGFEVVGANGDLHTVTDMGRSDDVELGRCFKDPAVAETMRRRLWSRNPPYSRTHFNPGLCIWDLALIRSDIGWYKQRLKWYWQAETKGYCTYLIATLINVFMDAAPLLDCTMHEKTDGLRSKFVEPAARHFNKHAYTDDPNNLYNKKARELGLDDIIARSIGGDKPAAASPAAAAPSAPTPLVKYPRGRLAVVHITDGNPDDVQRLVWSLRSISRYSLYEFDSFVVTPSGADVRDVADRAPQALRHGAVRYVRDIDKTLASVGITPGNWNRAWPFVVLYRLGIPLHPAFAQYDRVLYLDTDTLAMSNRVDRFLSADLAGYEIGGVVDTVQEEHDRIRNALDNDLRPEFAAKVRARYGDVLRFRSYVNAGVLLWNLPEIRKDLPWYRERLAMFWDAERRGKFGFLDQDFINAMMSVNPTFSMVYNWFTKSGVETGACVIRHYCARQYSRMAKKAEEMGILTNDEIRKSHGN